MTIKWFLPTMIKVADKKNFSFRATGKVDYYGDTNNEAEADGYPGTGGQIAEYDGISGYHGANGALVDVFLEDKSPHGQTAPEMLDFSNEGIKDDFSDLKPKLGQVFFIGDGQSGYNSGTLQIFTAPAGATRLFLGIADSSGFSGSPGCYEDNNGSFKVAVMQN